jgi:hypothetical protein
MPTLTTLTDPELIERIAYLKRQTHLGTWGERELSKLQAEATKRKLKI